MKNYPIIVILITSLFLRLYRLDDLMPFIGDFAWFYLSARDMILTGNIPLVGITSSHTWVHQGPLWTYLLAITLYISNFNPLSGAYLTGTIGAVTVYLIYKVGTQMFSKFVGLASAIFFATSPLVVLHSRMPYHTSLIPTASILFIFFLYKWIKGDVRFFPLAIFVLGILYNLELFTMVFWIMLLLVFAYGVIKKKMWIREAIKLKTVLLSVFLFLFTMLPMIIYDIRESSGFFQTTAFFRLIKIYLFSGSQTFNFETMRGVFHSLFTYNQRLVFLGSGIVALLLTVVSFFYLIVRHSSLARMTKSLLLLWVAIPLCAIIVSQTPSEAYVPVLFPPVILSISLLLNYIYKLYSFVPIIAIAFIAITNSYLPLAKNYLNGFSFSKRLTIAKEIIEKSEGKEYNLIGKGEASEHKSFTMNYEYLTWWLGHPPSKKPVQFKFVIEEK